MSENLHEQPDGATGIDQNSESDPTTAPEASFREEIDAMSEVATALEGLTSDARKRVLQWVVSMFAGATTDSDAGALKLFPGSHDSSGGLLSPRDQDDPAQFDDFADLYDAAGPKTDAERALIAACWASRDKRDFRAQEVNALLKDLGYGVSNITDALNSLIARKPNEVMQTRKSGAARQGRKDYRLTKAGGDRVRELLMRVGDDG